MENHISGATSNEYSPAFVTRTNKPEVNHRQTKTTRASAAMESGSSNALLSPPELSPLEQEVLDEYERLAKNMKKVSEILNFP